MTVSSTASLRPRREVARVVEVPHAGAIRAICLAVLRAARDLAGREHIGVRAHPTANRERF